MYAGNHLGMPCTVGLSQLNNNQINVELCFGDGTNKLIAELSRAGSLYPAAMNQSSNVETSQFRHRTKGM